MKTCPHCGQRMSGAPAEIVRILSSIHMPRRERQVADALLETFPRFAPKSLLCGRVYDDEREDVEWPGETLQSHISKLRKKMIGTGWSIESQRFDGYHLVNVERSRLSSAASVRAL